MSYGKDRQVYEPSHEFSASSRVSSMQDYYALYRASTDDPQAFWAQVAQRIQWRKPFSRVLEWDFDAPSIKWFEDGTLNVT